MPFEIDTGTIERAAVDYTPDWLRDQLPETAPEHVLVKAHVEHLIGTLRGYRTARNARGCLVKHWPFLRALSAEHPEQFDWVLIEYAEATSALS